MWNGFFGRRNFYTKCKSALKMIKLRMELIMKKRNSMQKFLKTDIADLLKNNLDYNAYGRVEGLYIELNFSCCYDYVQQCCKLVSDNLKAMHKERECPNELRVVVASLMHATSRFSDLLELRELRNMFTEKYGNVLDLYVSKEFVEMLKLNPPTMEMKFQLMKDIAKEHAILWKTTSLEHKLKKNTLKEASGRERVVSSPLTTTFDEKKDESKQDEARPRPKSVRSRFIRRVESDEGVDRENMKGKGVEEDRKDIMKLLEEDSEYDQEFLIDHLLKHYSTKPWTMTGIDRTRTARSARPSLDIDKELELEDGRVCRNRSSGSLYAKHLHPKLPDYDELASRVEYLRKM